MPMKPIQTATVVVAGLFIIRALMLIVMMSIEYSAHDDDSMHAKYPDRSDRMKVKMNFNHTDNVMMIKEAWTYRIDVQGWLVLIDVLMAAALLLGLPILLTVKQHFKRTSDEKELLMTVCLSFSAAIPVVVIFMLAGPRSYGSWIARELRDGDGKMWANFDKTAWQSLEMSYGMVEALGIWVAEIDLFFSSIGILLLVFLGKARAPHIITGRVYAVGCAIGCLQLAGFFALMWREVAWMPMQIFATVCMVISFFILVPVFYIFLGIELGKTDSLEDLDASLMGGGEKEMQGTDE